MTPNITYVTITKTTRPVQPASKACNGPPSYAHSLGLGTKTWLGSDEHHGLPWNTYIVYLVHVIMHMQLQLHNVHNVQTQSSNKVLFIFVRTRKYQNIVH